MNFKIAKMKAAMLGIGLLMLGSGAQAGELTFGLNAGIQTFSIAPGLYYSQQLGSNFGITALLEGKYTFAFPSDWFVGTGVAIDYTLPLLRDRESYLDGFADVGFAYSLNANRGDPFVGFGVIGSYKLAYNARVYAADTFQVAFDTRYGALRPQIIGYVGGQFDPISSVNLYAQLDYAFNLNPGSGKTSRYDAHLTGEYSIIPNLKAALTVGSRTEDPWYATLGLRYTLQL
jgi:hypothetical protein